MEKGSLTNLICLEDGTRLDYDVEEERGTENNLFIFFDDRFESQSNDDENEYIEMLVEKETSFDSNTCRASSESSSTAIDGDDWMKLARSNAITWILKMRSCFGFGVHTAYVAVTYLDRFFARRTIDKGKTWAVHLVSVACLSLAAKMEECRAPALFEYQIDDYQFDTNTIQRMELLVLSTLDWRLSSITPFSYLKHFVSKFPFDNQKKEMAFRAVGFILVTMEDNNLIDYRPSVIAAAAVLAASDAAMTKKMVEAKMSLISLESEQVFACYSRMIEESQQDKLKLNNPSNFLLSSEQSSNFASTDSSLDAIMATGTLNMRRSKRRRLQFDQIQ